MVSLGISFPMLAEEEFTAADVVSNFPVPRGGRWAPAIAAAQHTIADIHTLLYPKRQTGYGHRMHALQPFIAHHLQEMLVVSVKGTSIYFSHLPNVTDFVV